MKCFKFCVVVLVITSIFSTSNAIGGLGNLLGGSGNSGGLTNSLGGVTNGLGGVTNNLGGLTNGLGGVTNSLSSVTSVASTLVKSVTTTVTQLSSVTSKVTEVAGTVSKLTRTATSATAALSSLSKSVTSAFGSITSVAKQATSVLKLEQTVFHGVITKVQTVTQKLVQVAGVSSVTHTVVQASYTQVVRSIRELITVSRQLFQQVSTQFDSSSSSVSSYAAAVGRLIVTIQTTLKVTSVTITSLAAFTQTKTSHTEIFQTSITQLETLIQTFRTTVTKVTELRVIVKTVVVNLETILSRFPSDLSPSNPTGNMANNPLSGLQPGGSPNNNSPFNSDPSQGDPRNNSGNDDPRRNSNSGNDDPRRISNSGNDDPRNNSNSGNEDPRNNRNSGNDDPRRNSAQEDPSAGSSFARRHPPTNSNTFTGNNPNINNNVLNNPRSSDPNNSDDFSPAAILQQNVNQSPGQSGVLYQSPTTYRTLPVSSGNQNSPNNNSPPRLTLTGNNPDIRNEVLRGDGGGNRGPVQQNANQSPGQSGVLYQSPTSYNGDGFSQTDPSLTSHGNNPRIINNVLNSGGRGGGNFDPVQQNANQSPGQSGVVYQSPTTYQTTPLRWYTSPNNHEYFGNNPRISNSVLGGGNQGPVQQNANQSPGQSGVVYQSPTTYHTQVRTRPQNTKPNDGPNYGPGYWRGNNSNDPSRNTENTESDPSRNNFSNSNRNFSPDFINNSPNTRNSPTSFQTVHPNESGAASNLNNYENYLPHGFLRHRDHSLIYQYIGALRAVVNKITSLVNSLPTIDTQQIIISIERVKTSIQTLIIFIHGENALRNNSQIIYGGLQQISLNIQQLVSVIQKVIQKQTLDPQTVNRLELALKVTSAIAALTIIGVKELVVLYNSHSRSKENIRISKNLLLKRLIKAYQRVFANDYKGKLNQPNGLNSYASSINGLNNSYKPIYHGISHNAVQVMHGIISSSRQQLREIIASHQDVGAGGGGGTGVGSGSSSNNIAVLQNIHQRLGLVNEILEHYKKYGHKGNFDNYIKLSSTKQNTSYSDVVSYSHDLSRNIVEHSGIPSVSSSP